MNCIKIYEVGSVENGKLQCFASIANEQFARENKTFYVGVEECYFDYGQKWKYTALITTRMPNNNSCDSWQSVCPRDYEKILYCDSFEELYRMAVHYATEIMKGKICVDL